MTLKDPSDTEQRPRAPKRTLKDRVAAHPSVDLLLVIMVVGIYFAIVHFRLPEINILAFAESSQRLSVYAAGAGVASLIAGFTGTAIAQYGSSSGPIVDVLRRVHGKDIRKSWLSIVRWLLVAAILNLLAMVIDSKASPRFSDYLFWLASGLLVTKFLRLSLLFQLLLATIDKQAEMGQTSPSQQSGPDTARDDQDFPDVEDHG